MSLHKAMDEIVRYVGATGSDVYRVTVDVVYNRTGSGKVVVYKYDTDEHGNKKIEGDSVAKLPKETYLLEKYDEAGFCISEFVDITCHGDDGKTFIEVRQ